jgi:stearoyl-CoA desaturase (delta-9 desaturase)
MHWNREPTLRRLAGALVRIGSTAVVATPHVLLTFAFFVRPSPAILVATLVSYAAQVFGITAGYHRYFSHHAFKTTRAFQFVLAWLGCTAMQNGPAWWASSHRRHHRFADRPGDPHSPVSGSLWHAHLGWVLSGAHDRPDLANAKDVTCFRELMLLERFKWIPTLMLGALAFALGGLAGFVWVFGVATCVAFHAPLLVNSVGHRWGGRRFETRDASRNNAWLGVLVLGEGWHNNHHHAPALAKHGLAWWEVDLTYVALRALAAFGVVWSLREAPQPRGPSFRREASDAVQARLILRHSGGDPELPLGEGPRPSAR